MRRWYEFTFPLRSGSVMVTIDMWTFSAVLVILAVVGWLVRVKSRNN